jgi:hypothetical protein
MPASLDVAAIDENPLVVARAVAAFLRFVSFDEKADIVELAESTCAFFVSISRSGALAMSTSCVMTLPESKPPRPVS